VIRLLVVVLGAAIVFAAGVAVGMALHDNPKPGIVVTSDSTLHP
jgi:hypothetical protein